MCFKMKFKIELINIGRDDVCQKYEQEADSLDEIANLTHVKVKRFLMSSIVSLEPNENDEGLWDVFVGEFRKVGEVRIKEIMEIKNEVTK